MLPEKLKQRLSLRANENAIRSLGSTNNLIDFSSNDYLGLAKSKSIFIEAHNSVLKSQTNLNGATGSRLLTGNNTLYNSLETQLKGLYSNLDALVYNSGYAANIGLFSSIPQRGDIILYDELIHTSIREGISLSLAKSYKFHHNNYQHLQTLISQFEKQYQDAQIYVVSESVFSMDGDQPNLHQLVNICAAPHTHLIIDEAHSFGVFGKHGLGLVEQLGLSNQVFSTIITFGKALGNHGAAILAPKDITTYLINFSKSFIYTTALPSHNIASISVALKQLTTKIGDSQRKKLESNITFFKSKIADLNIVTSFIESNSSIQCCIIGGNEKTKHVSEILKLNTFDVKPILSPTVPKGQERLRICLHSFNSEEEITDLLLNLATFVQK